MVDYQVRAMTWNIWWRFGPRWRERQPGILATIQRFTPDVVGLQEASSLLLSHGMLSTASFPPTIERWWLIFVGMTADTR